MSVATDPASRKSFAQIAESCKQRDLVPLIGAGFSRNINDDVQFAMIMQALGEYLPSSWPKSASLLKHFDNNSPRALEFFVWFAGQHKARSADPSVACETGKSIMRDTIRKYLGAKGLTACCKESEPAWKQHLDIVKGFPAIITTNWDRTLEIAIEYLAINYKRSLGYDRRFPVGDEIETYPFRPTARRRCQNVVKIIKFHGDLADTPEEQQSDLVATEGEYVNRLMKPGKIERELRSTLENRGLLLIGYRFDDINLRYTLNQMQLLGRSVRSYLIETGVRPKNKATVAKNRHLEACFGLTPCYLGASHQAQRKGRILAAIKAWTKA